ncbi:MAG: PASTA domain-containing protein [Bacteroidetes bacterium]|nr:PASTA domain-containing protein [Bacteroidota bacterium]
MKILKTLLFLGIVTAVLLIGTYFFLNFYTNHDDPLVQVPDIEGVRIDKALRMLEEEGFDYEVTDTMYRDGVPLLSVIDQNPVAGSEVKKGRKVYIVLNSKDVPNVEMPDLAGHTGFGQAVTILKSKGLDLGRKISMPLENIMDPDSEPVLEQRIHGDSTAVAPGKSIKRHTKIDLVVGRYIERSSGNDSIGNLEPAPDEL